MTFNPNKPPNGGPFSSARVNIPSRTIGQLPQGRKTIWAVGGGKGGVGKTILTSNMAVYLSWLNKRVVVIDLDLGGSNLHTALGVAPPRQTLSDLLSGSVEDIHTLLQPTSIRGLELISGAQDHGGITNLSHTQKAHLMRKINDIQADYVLLDLGAGTSSNTLDFFLFADQKIILVTPEPTSIENAYRFIKLAFYRMLRASTPTPQIRQLVEMAMNLKNAKGIHSPKDLLNEVKRLSPTEGAELAAKMAAFHLSLVVNQVRVRAEADIGKSILLVCERYFGIQVDYIGHIPYDAAVWQSIRKRIPFLVDTPNCTAVTHLEGILRCLLKNQVAKAG